MQAYLARRVTRVLAEFGDVDDLVDDVLDVARNRCAKRARSRAVNRRFVFRTTIRVALGKRDTLEKHQHMFVQRFPRGFPEGAASEVLARLHALRQVDGILLVTDGRDRRIILEVLRQFRDNDRLSYEQLGEALDCGRWTARAWAARCFSRIRAHLKPGVDGHSDELPEGPRTE